jgi:adenine-specific DNA-methyltransferase
MTQQPIYGLHNPHPLSQMRTELVWEGKYDEYGQRREVDIAGCAMPMQKIEGIDEPRREAAANQQLSLFEQQNPRVDDFRNRLIWGDNKLVMASLLQEFKGKVDLIYIDPPFDVGADFTMSVAIGDEKESVQKEQSTLEMVAYRDIWGKGADSYIHMLYDRLTLMKELLSEKGLIVVHLGDKISAKVRSLMDEIFGESNYRNSIIVPRGIKNVQAQFEDIRGLSVGHDVLLCYTKSDVIRIPKLTLPGALEKQGKWDTFWRGTDRPTMRYELFGIKPASGQWRWSKERAYKSKQNYEEFISNAQGLDLDDYYKNFLEQGVDLDFTRLSSENTVQYYIPPRDYKMASTLWATVKTRGVNTEYATEKNEEFIDIIINWLSEPNQLVADFFCGSGTTGAVAERLGRRWIMADLGRFAIHTSRKRLIELQRTLHKDSKPYRAFDVYNLGRYERQWWQQERLQGADTEHRRVILEFFRAEVLTNTSSPLLHGRKAGAFCHVDGIDSMFTRDEAQAVALATAAAGGRECYCLAWEFEMDLHLRVNALVTELGVKLKLVQIPREIMEKNRKAPPPFLEVAVLAAEAVYRSPLTPLKKGGIDPEVPLLKGDLGGSLRTVDIKLTQFLPSLAEVPTKELEAIRERAIRSGFDFIDFWAIDFNWQPGKPFTHDWQDYRTRKDRSLKTISDAAYTYPAPGKYTACIKVVDTFGCDTSITIEVEV